MKINIICGDLFSVSCDAYVNPTDAQLSGSGGIDQLIHARGGDLLRQECASHRGKLKVGQTVITGGGDLPVKYILHTACPKCADEKDSGYPLLAECYQNILSKAASKSDIHHLALPLVGSGVSGYNLHTPSYADSICSLTAVTILSTIMRFYRKTLHTVTIVCSSKEKYDSMLRTYRWISGQGISKRSRIRGSLLGGAVGDALGYPVEFRDAAGSLIHDYILDPESGKALISDDTQMTLFTACGLLWGYSRGCMKGIGGDLWSYIAIAYEDWLKTQQPDYQKHGLAISWIRNIPQLNVCRAPGLTCLSALQSGGGSIGKPLNNSKGCGGVMRIAPIALYGAANNHWNQSYNAKICANAAAITHGHPLGWMSAAALGNILYDIMQNFSLEFAVQDTVLLLRKQYADYPDTEIMVSLLRKAASLSAISPYTSSYNLMAEYDITGQLGEGWVGEEALAVGLYCAFACLGSGFERCVRNAIWHKGDSDSTASIAGQIFGAYYGEEAIPQKWLRDLELREIITEIADDLTSDCRMSEYSAYRDETWVRKYLFPQEDAHLRKPSELPPHVFFQVPWPEENAPSRKLYQYDTNNLEGLYQVSIEDGTIYHVAPTKKDVQTESHGFGPVSNPQYDPETQVYSEPFGWVKCRQGNTVEGYYKNTSFKLIPNFADGCVEIFTNTSPNPWVGTIRRRYDEWGNPIEIEFRDSSCGISTYLLEALVSSSDYLRHFFQKQPHT